MTTVGNVGIGLLILIFVWIVALVLFIVGVKLQNNISWIALGCATIISILLLVIPTDKRRPAEETETTEKDYTDIYKKIFVGFIWLSGIIGFGFFFVLHCIEPIHPKPIKSFNFS
ncbi:unnamed protein product [Acanthoscelides obtectus]|uniref:Transmembrane protein 218 n=1 Tax=Acanthoscelides obtectus TaxID=200917 RepID=A0A9P0LIY1_ACAOB|nr:unnamed protein product [Acanthoscelides obtectus]CAK1662822.1 Transmembrane protein 218 [Acanthoscelides obtectus]